MAEKLPIAFLAGLVSVVTPCVLPLLPGYLSAVSAVEVERLGERGVGRRVVAASLPFIGGFTVVFVVLGAGAAAVASVVAKPTQAQIAGFGLGAAFVAAGIAFAHAMRAFRWVRSHYAALRVASGATLLVLGLLLFFGRDWWLRVALDELFTKIGLGSL